MPIYGSICRVRPDMESPTLMGDSRGIFTPRYSVVLPRKGVNNGINCELR